MLFAAVLSGLLRFSPPHAVAAEPAPRCGIVPDPDAPLQTLSPDQIPALVASQQGCVVLLEVYASWCGSCTQIDPAVTALVERFRPMGLNTIGLSVDTSVERLTVWRQTHGRVYAPLQVEGWTLSNLTTVFGQLGASFQEAIPLFVLFDTQGQTVLHLTEPKKLSTLETRIHDLLLHHP